MTAPSEKVEPSDEARELAVDIATRIYFECDTLHDGPGSLDSEYDRIAAEIDALVRTSLASAQAALAASEKRVADLEAALTEQYRDVTMRVEWERDREVCVVVETDSGKSPEAFRIICRLLAAAARTRAQGGG
jgi:hypothetical protein